MRGTARSFFYTSTRPASCEFHLSFLSHPVRSGIPRGSSVCIRLSIRYREEHSTQVRTFTSAEESLQRFRHHVALTASLRDGRYMPRMSLISRAVERGSWEPWKPGVDPRACTCKLIARGSWQDGGKGSVGIEVNRVTLDFLSVGRGKGAIVRERDRCARITNVRKTPF